MKLNKKTLRKMILKEIKNMTESQVYPGSGLSHGFNNMELASKIYDAISSERGTPEPKQNLMALRKTAIKREAKLQHALSQEQDSYGQGNIKQEIMILNSAIDQLDHHLGLYKHGVIHRDDDRLAQYGLGPKNYALKRRYQRDHQDVRKTEFSDSYSFDPNNPRYL